MGHDGLSMATHAQFGIVVVYNKIIFSLILRALVLVSKACMDVNIIRILCPNLAYFYTFVPC